jgi:hypothetical protein
MLPIAICNIQLVNRVYSDRSNVMNGRNVMSEDDATLQELINRALQREKAGARWAYFAVHLVMAILATVLMWVLVITGSEPLGAGPILLTLLAFFGCFLHLRNVLVDSGMYKRSSSELLAQELLRRGIDLQAASAEKRKRLSTVHLASDGELVSDDATDEQLPTSQRTANNQRGN